MSKVHPRDERLIYFLGTEKARRLTEIYKNSPDCFKEEAEKEGFTDDEIKEFLDC
jgi:DNA-binding MarR family transcriptional regulator